MGRQMRETAGRGKIPMTGRVVAIPQTDERQCQRTEDTQQGDAHARSKKNLLDYASVGLYGVMAYSVTRRRKEIGLRMALGVSRAAVLRVVLRDRMALVCYGILAGLAA